MMRKIYFYSIVFVAALLCSCNKGEIDFSYSPSKPRCGQSISFSNASTKGDSDSKWEWVFGDGTTSTLKNPTKIYRKAGVYMVTLTLDSKSFQKAAKEITVFDSVPTFTASTDSISTYRDVTFTALTYNPYNLNLEYAWTLPEHAVLTQGSLTDKSITVYFTRASASVSVKLSTTLGNVTTETVKTYSVAETPATAVFLSTSEGQILRHKIYNGIPTEADTVTPSGITFTNARQLLIGGNTLFIFELRSGTDGAIYAMNLQTGSTEVVIRNAASVTDYVYSTGCVKDDYLYFADIANKNIYRLPVSTRNATFTDGKTLLYASESTLTGMSSGVCGGVAFYSDLILIGSTKGIYRFTETDISSGVAPATGVITTESAPLNLRVDPLAGKIYSVEGEALYVRNIDGSYPVKLADGIVSSWTLTTSNSLNRVVFGTEQGIMYMPLVQTRNNTTTAVPAALNDINALSIAIDETER